MDGANTILELIADRRVANDGVLIVALDGFSASGKSTLAEALAANGNAAVVHGDDFYRDLAEMDRLALSPEEGVQMFFDWERMRRDALVPLRASETARFKWFDWESGSGLAGEVAIAPQSIIVVEGVYSARAEFEDLVDLTVFVDTSENERIQRRRLRHDPHDWEERWDASEQHYFTFLRPPSSFGLVVDGHA